MKDNKKILKPINGTNENNTHGFILCGGDDVCSWWDGLCNPKYH